MPVLPNSVLPGASIQGQNIGDTIINAVTSSALGGLGQSGALGHEPLNVAGMFRYSTTQSQATPQYIFPDASTDWRVRVSLPRGADYFYADKSNLVMQPLWKEPASSGAANAIANAIGRAAGAQFANRIGVVFPYTPEITVTHKANYTPQKLTHNNYTSYFYENSEVEAITINTEFTVQSVDEGQYLMATIYFFRALTKMFFGMDPKAGNPPPLVFLNGYGQYYLPNVPCVVTSFSHTMPSDVDYMDIPEVQVTQTAYNPRYQTQSLALNSTRMPTTSKITLSLQPVYSRMAQSGGFSLEDFARGALVNAQGGGRGVAGGNPVTAFGVSQKAKNVTSPPVGGFL
jgi:hypothetical protein